MENKNGFLYGLIILGVFYLALFIFSSAMDKLESILSKPMITFGVPILILLVILFLNKKDDNETKKNKE